VRGSISKRSGAEAATASPVRRPAASSANTRVVSSSGAFASDRFSTVTSTFTTARSSVTTGVVTNVPQWATRSGPLSTSQTLR
jgi:hypothetical protein